MNSSSGKLAFQFNFGPAVALRPRDPDAPGRILVLADLSGRGQRGLREPLAGRRVQHADCDNLDSVFAGFGASLSLPLAAAPNGAVAARFASLEDFHPDQLLQRLAPLQELLAARRWLQSPATAAQGAQELGRLLGTPGTAPAPAPVESGDDTLARLLGGAPSPVTPAAPKPASGVDIQSIIKNIVGTTGTVPAAPAGQAGLLSAAELELSARLRSVLHQAEFQTLEAAWRSVDLLVRRCPDEERIKLSVLDVTLDELASDLAGLHRLLRDQPPDLIVGHYTFGASPADLETLGGLAQLAAALRTSFLAAAHPSLVGCDSFAQHPDPDDWKFPAAPDVRAAWQTLRALPAAAHVGLVLPRFLLRQPYGTGSDRIDSFNFEELPDVSAHEAFLWGNSAFLCAQVLAEALAAAGEEMDTSGAGDVGELPMFRFKQDGESAMKPCAEAWLVDRAADVISQQGFIPCLSIKGRDAVRVAGMRSVSSSSERLAGRWGGG